MKFNFKQQLVLYFFLFGFIVALMSSFLIVSINKETRIDKYINKSSFVFQEKEELLLNEINRYTIFLNSIAHDTLLEKALNANTDDIDIKQINNILLSRTKGEKNTLKLRYIDNNGMEISNIKKGYKYTTLFSLQDKSSRYYVKNTKNLEKSKLWFSNIDLNREFGIIEKPIVPTLRIIYPIFIENKKQGIMIINILMNDILKELSKATIYNIYLVDKNGEFIWHKTKDNDFSWSGYLENKKNLKDFYPNNYQNILNKDEFIGKRFYSKKINFQNGEEIKMILEIKKSVLKLDLTNLLVTMAKGLFITIFLSIPFIYFVSIGLNKIKSRYEEELCELNDNLQKSNIELEEKTIEFANEAMKVKHFNKTLEKRVHTEVEKNILQNKQLLEQSRLAQMGEMISMIAHQWRQPLTAISATTNNLSFKLMLDDVNKEEFTKEINLISDYSQHLSKTIDDFRSFFQTNKEKEKTNLTDIITSTLDIVKLSIQNKNINLITHLNCEKEFETYPNELKQVVLNLIKNAEDILLENNINNPTITIESTCGTNCTDLFLIIKDNAGGIPENIIDKIFDPYFSTKKEKDGTGLGLYMSKTIIEDHCDGELNVSNDTDGAVFTIKLK